MNETDIQRLNSALDYYRLAPHIRAGIFNIAVGNTQLVDHKERWAALRSALQAHIYTMRSNASRVPAAMRPVRDEYYGTLIKANDAIRAYPTHTPIPEGKERWQEWIDKDTRVRIANKMRDLYAANAVRGRRLVPYAPELLRKDNQTRIDKCLAAIAAERKRICPDDPTSTARSPQPIGALILAACRQAEREIKKYTEDLAEGRAHPYENPAKVNWQHYCTPAMRQRVRSALAGEPVSLDGLSSFYIEGASAGVNSTSQ